MNKNEAIMKLFKAYLGNDKCNVNKEALKKGIYIKTSDENIVKLACDIWGKDGYLLNQTFHKSFNTVINSSDFELYIMQIIHYIATYNSDGEYIYIPKEKLDIKELRKDIKLVKINKITENELKDKLNFLCKSNVGLSKTSIDCIKVLIDFVDIDIKDIDNKEIKVIMYDKLNVVPSNNIEFLRYLIFVLIKRTLLIKDKVTIDGLKNCDKDRALELINRYINLYGIINLAEIFNRFKLLFLALKGDNLKLNYLINRISKLSKKYHKPMKINYLDNFISYCDYINLDKVNIFKIIKIKNYLEYRKLNSNNYVYKIRNGKVFVDNRFKNIDFNFDKYIDILDNIIINKLKNNVYDKKIYLDENISFVLPDSEKQFVGNIPCGSYINLNKDNLIFGIHWFNVNNNRVDLDLKLISNEYSIGWNVNYKENNKLIFTGDITNAINGASEYIYVDKSIGNTIFSLKVNNYTKKVDNVYYDIIIARGNKDKLKENYIVDVNDIILKIPNNLIEVTKSEHSIGTVYVNNENIKLIMIDLSTANRMVSFNNNLEECLRKYLINEAKCKCKLYDYLIKAGAIIVNDINGCDYDFCLENLNINSFFSLFK